jgi:hypothetical protein
LYQGFGPFLVAPTNSGDTVLGCLVSAAKYMDPVHQLLSTTLTDALSFVVISPFSRD